MLTTISPPAAVPGRLLSLDVLRGLTIAGMILVTDPGSYAHVYPQLLHAVWNGPTATDLIFPCFLVMMGVSIPLSFTGHLSRGVTHGTMAGRVLRRSALLVGLGLLLNGFPHYDLTHLRVPGVLQRIGICYLLTSLLFLALDRPAVTRRTRSALLVLAAGDVLGLYWALLTFYPTPGFGPGRLDSAACPRYWIAPSFRCRTFGPTAPRRATG